MSEAYTNGWNAFCDNIDAEENPYYSTFGDLPQEYYDWSRGWNEAEDSRYRKLEDNGSAHWQECLAERSDD